MSNPRPKGPALFDYTMWAKAGIDPKTGLPDRYKNGCSLKTNVKIQLRVKDEQDAINRYKAYNIPLNLSSQEIERMLYHKFELIFFYFEPLDEYYLMPYAFDDGLDFYGRPIYVHPVPYASGAEADSNQLKAQREFLRTVKLKVIYDVQLPEDYINEETGEVDEKKVKELLTTSAVIIRDYTPQWSENGIPRVQMQDALLDCMADCIPYSRTALKNSTGVRGMRVTNPDEYSNVLAANVMMEQAALHGDQNIPVVGQIDFQDLASGNIANAEEFFKSLQGYNNFRLSLYGLDNNGLYEKTAYVNNLQSGINNVGLSLTDGLSQRQNACNIINSIWGLGFWYDISESVSGADTNGDGITYDEEDQSGQTNNTPLETGGEEE